MFLGTVWVGPLQETRVKHMISVCTGWCCEVPKQLSSDFGLIPVFHLYSSLIIISCCDTVDFSNVKPTNSGFLFHMLPLFILDFYTFGVKYYFLSGLVRIPGTAHHLSASPSSVLSLSPLSSPVMRSTLHILSRRRCCLPASRVEFSRSRDP